MMKSNRFSLKYLFLLAGSSIALAGSLQALEPSIEPLPKKTSPGMINFGMIADVHQDLQRDAPRRLEAFITEANAKRPDFIIQLGDLSHGKKTREIVDVWDRYKGKSYHVLGNHDANNAPTKQIISIQRMPGAYYSFDQGAYHFVVLDTNHKTGKLKNTVDADQLAWLKKDLEKTKKPTLVFTHAGLDEIWDNDGCQNRTEVRDIFRAVNQDPKHPGKVIACFSGHHHLDDHSIIDGIHYFQINSASYYYIGKARNLSNGQMAEYKDPVYAWVTLDPKERTITIKGKSSEFLPPAPTKELFSNADKLSASISDRKVTYPPVPAH